MPSTFAYLLDADSQPVLSEAQSALVSDFCSEYSGLFDSYEDALENLVFFDREESGETISEIANSSFHKRDYLEAFAVKHMDGILEFINHAYSVLGPAKPYPDDRLDNMFGAIDFERDDFALAKMGKIGVHIAGKLAKDYECVAENYLEPCHREPSLSCGF